MAKSTSLAIVLSIILYGVGQIYLDRVGRGIVILGVGLTLSIGLTWYIGFWGAIPAVGLWIWQIYDAYKIAKQGKVEPKKDVSTGL